MRRVLIGDVSALARVLHAEPRSSWCLTVKQLVEGAEAASAHYARTGTAHWIWGTGSLASAASRRERSTADDFEDDAYCRAWIVALEGLIAHRARIGGRGASSGKDP